MPYNILKRVMILKTVGLEMLQNFQHPIVSCICYVPGDQNAIKMAKKTLDQMYKGGLFDHLSFGFSRYSTDDEWLVPHFEKMLYDNALLIITYLEAYEVTEKNDIL